MRKIGITILSIFIFFACEKEEEYPVIPEIDFTSFNVIPGDGQSTIAEGILVFSFVDGDGNIGFFGNDTSANPNFDVFITEFTKRNSTFEYYREHRYWLPYFEEGIYRKSIKGSIDIYLPRTILSPDTVYYEFYITDRDGNESNVETTPEIIYSERIEQL